MAPKRAERPNSFFIRADLLSLLTVQFQAILPSTVPFMRFCLYRSTCSSGGVAIFVGRNLAECARADRAPARFRRFPPDLGRKYVREKSLFLYSIKSSIFGHWLSYYFGGAVLHFLFLNPAHLLPASFSPFPLFSTTIERKIDKELDLESALISARLSRAGDAWRISRYVIDHDSTTMSNT